MSTTKPSNVQLHVADANKELIFVHPETTFNQVIDSESGKSLQDFLTERDSQRVNFTRAFYPLTATIDGQTEFMFNDDKFDQAHATVVLHVNGEFMHPVEEYTVVKEVGLLPKIVLVKGLKVNDWLHITVQRGITSKAPVIVPKYPPFSDGYLPTGKKYGVSIAKAEASSSNRVQYIEDAVGMVPAKMNYSTGVFDLGSWSDVWFIKDNYPVMLNPDGTEAYKLNPMNYSQKVDKTASNIAATTHDMNAMSRIPKVFIKQWEDTTHEYVLVSDVKHDDSWNAFAHTDNNGIIKDSLYLSIFKGSLLNNKLRSLSGGSPTALTTPAQEKTYTTANGTGWDLRSWSQRNLINSLLTIISKSDDGQSVFGNGNVSASFSLACGTLNTNGQFFGSNNNTTQVKVFHMEGWWGDINERINGLICGYGVLKVKMSGPYDFAGTNFVSPGISLANGEGYIKTTGSSQYGRLPKSVAGGSSSTYVADILSILNDGTYIAAVGGGMQSTTKAGPFSVNITHATALQNFGAGLSYI